MTTIVQKPVFRELSEYEVKQVAAGNPVLVGIALFAAASAAWTAGFNAGRQLYRDMFK